MTVTTIAWGGTNLPTVGEDGYKVEDQFFGTSSRTANGTLRMDYIAEKAKITMEWKGLTSSERTTLRSAYDAKGSTSNTLTLPDGQSFSVLAVQNSWKEIDIYHDERINAFRYDITIIFDEA